jgi:ribonuclease E
VPYLRFARDPRGYESTSVLHNFRRGGRSRSRVLYWFRTPPNVKVGRAALDEEAIREIEKHHPDLEFDWTKILETQPPPQTAEPRRPERRPRRGARPGEGARADRSRPTPAQARGRGRVDVLVEPPSEIAASPSEIVLPVDDLIAAPPETHFPEARPGGSDQTAAPDEFDAAHPGTLGEGHELENGAATDADADAVAAIEDWESPDDALPAISQVSAVEALVGAEGLARLRARHAEIQARITERGGEPGEVLDLRRRSETLDPDTWVTSEEARQALEHYEARLEEFRRVLGPRRRRSRRGGRRRRGRRDAASGADLAPANAAAPPEAEAEPSADPADAPDDPGEEG